MKNDTPNTSDLNSLSEQAVQAWRKLVEADQSACVSILAQLRDLGPLFAPHQQTILDLKQYFYEIAERIAQLGVQLALIHRDLNDHQKSLNNIAYDPD